MACVLGLSGERLTSLAARMIVVICERSPHSARKVREKAWRKMGETNGPKNFSLLRRGGVVVRASGSGAADREACMGSGAID